MANKYTQIMQYRRALGTPCPYCHRAMLAADPNRFPTRDHVHPRSKGGQRTVWACWVCNNLKRDMTLPEWEAFMAANPNWWEKRAYGAGEART